MPHSHIASNTSKPKKFLILPICVAVTATMMVGCGSTPTSSQRAGTSTLPQGGVQANNPYNMQNGVQTNPTSQTTQRSTATTTTTTQRQFPVAVPQSTNTAITAQTASVPLLDAEDLAELEELLQATDMAMVEDNQLAIQQYGNLWNRLRAGYGLDQSQYTYNSRIEAQKNWFIPRQDYLNRLSARASRYLYHTVREAERRNIPTELALLPVIESSYDPTATSNASAAGLWQFIPSTGRIYGLNQSSTYDGRRDVIESTRAAYDFLTTLYNQFGSWELALAAYNAGPGRVQRAIDYNESRGLPTDFWSLSLPAETRSYVPRFLAVAQIVGSPEQYGVNFPAIANRQHFRSVPVNYGASLDDVAQITGVSADELRMLNPALIAGTVDTLGPQRVVVPNQVSTNLDNQIASLTSSGLGQYNAASPTTYNNDPYPTGTLARSSDGLAEFASNARIPSQTDSYIAPATRGARSNESPLSVAERQRINAQLRATNTLPTTSASVTSNATIIQEPPLSQAERDFIASQIRQSAPHVSQVVSPVDGNINLNAVQTQQSVLAAQGRERRLSYATPQAATRARPQGTRSVYVVQRGDTLSGIANRASVSWRDIADWNQINPQANLLAGSTLYLYNARPLTSTVSSSSSSTNTAPTRYTVQSGDTLIGTANRFGLSASQLASYNNLQPNSDLRIGQRLWLVPNNSASNTSRPSTPSNPNRVIGSRPYTGETQTYRVRSGETLTGLANRYNVSIGTLAAMNDLTTRAQLQVGQRLTVPVTNTNASTNAPARSSNNASSNNASSYSGPTTRYTVKSGDNLTQLANSLNVSRADIASLNSFDANARLQRGQTITLPASSEQVNLAINKQPVTYRIQSGDTLIGLANRYNLSVSQLATANDLASNAQLIRGRTLTIPVAGQTPTASNNSSSNSSNSTASSLGQTTSYTVRSGDTLIGIARRYNVSVSALASANDLATNAQVRIGQRLQVPANGDNNATSQSSASNSNFDGSYQVSSGDTLIGIARRYNVSVSALASANDLATNAQVRIGQRLKVPTTSNTQSSNQSAPSQSSGTTRASNFDDTYTVQSGDTLIGLARRYGISTSQLASANDLASNAGLQRGQRLRVPALTMSYTVKSGDTLIGLSNRYGVSRQQIADLNDISTSAELRIGQTLTIPR